MAKITDEEKKELIDLLKAAAEVEHALLNAYLYAGCTIKSTPQEFKFTTNHDGSRGGLNKRRAIQFERARAWKRLILEICHEEMMHLHYVQCLLRALGERPHFELPVKNADGAWFIPNWVIKVDGSNKKSKSNKEGNGTKIPLVKFSLDTVKRFIAYESTDTLQNSNIFSDENIKAYKAMNDFEFKLRQEIALFRIGEDDQNKQKVKDVLEFVYKNMPAQDMPDKDNKVKISGRSNAIKKAEKLEEFQSIRDLYNRIQDLYEKAIESGLIRPDLIQKNLNGEFQENGEGLLPVGPVRRSSRNAKLFYKNNNKNVKMDFQDVKNIIEEIVEEGEGYDGNIIDGFVKNLQNIDKRKYAEHYINNFYSIRQWRTEPDPPEYFYEGENIRQSHLYRFIQIFTEILHEQELDPCFQPSRRVYESIAPISELPDAMKELSEAIKELSDVIQELYNRKKDAEKIKDDELIKKYDQKIKEYDLKIKEYDKKNNYDKKLKEYTQKKNAETIRELSGEITSYFNANFLSMITWLSRIYITDFYDADKGKRQAIEQIATWPLMSMTIRPFLEIISFFPIDKSNLFNLHDNTKYTLTDTKNLQTLVGNKESQIKYAEIDQCIFKILNQTAEWSQQAVKKFKSIENMNTDFQGMVISRLESFKNLAEFEIQFSYREHGGFSDGVPTNPNFPKDDIFDYKYSESPENIQLYTKDSYVLKLSFCGCSKMQFATDPEPPTDEAGCSGSTMFHAADGDDKKLTRSILCRPCSEEIVRDACDLPLGVKVYQIELKKVKTDKLVFDESNGDIDSNLELLSFYNPQDMFINLEMDENKNHPIYLGDNQTLWDAGEPIDPFILSINDGASRTKIVQREVFNENKSMRNMAPIQRSNAHRGPQNVASPNTTEYTELTKKFCKKAWNYMPESYRKFFKDGKSINFNEYQNSRSKSIFNKLVETLNNKTLKDNEWVDQVESLYQRLFFLPFGNTFAAFRLQFIYWHTISGIVSDKPVDNNIFKHFRNEKYIVEWSEVERYKPNSRWYITYTMSLGDFDSLNNGFYGDLYIPVKVTQLNSN